MPLKNIYWLYQNVMLPKCFITKKFFLNQNVPLPKSHVTKMPPYQNVMLPKCPLTKTSFYQNVPFTKTSFYQNVPLPKRHVTKMPCYQNVCCENVHCQSVLDQNIWLHRSGSRVELQIIDKKNQGSIPVLRC